MRRTVPRVIGLTLTKARAKIRAKHCSVGRIPAHSLAASRPRDRPEPEGGEAVKRVNFRVNLVVGRR